MCYNSISKANIWSWLLLHSGSGHFFSVVQWVFSYMVENHKHMFAVQWYRSHVTIFFPFYRGTVSFLIWYREISILLWYTLSLVICYSLLSLLLPTTSFHLRAASNYIRQFYFKPSVHGFEYATLSACLHYRPRKRAWELGLESWWIRMQLCSGTGGIFHFRWHECWNKQFWASRNQMIYQRRI